MEHREVEPATTGEPVALSLVIPAFNEATRIGATVRRAAAYLSAQRYRWELIVVDDGSDDGTAEVARRAAGDDARISVVTIPHGGKAAAVRAGFVRAQGDAIAFADADLATPLDHLSEAIAALAGGCDIVIGSREGIGARRIGEPAYRHLMGRGFNALVRLLVLPGVHDTQCGFKVFRRAAADAILARTRLYRGAESELRGARVTAFDVEYLVIGRRLGLSICTIAVTWTYGTQSKVNPATDTVHNLLDVLKVKIYDWQGRYGPA